MRQCAYDSLGRISEISYAEAAVAKQAYDGVGQPYSLHIRTGTQCVDGKVARAEVLAIGPAFPEKSRAYTHFLHGATHGFEVATGGIFGSATITKSSVPSCACKP